MELSQSYLKEHLRYDPDTGHFFRLKASGGRRAGVPVGHVNKKGYRLIGVGGRQHRAHRLAFLYMEGKLPQLDVDHINHMRDDNRWLNLRVVTPEDQARNRGISKKNRAGMFGISKQNGAWCAMISNNGKKIYLGSYGSLRDARIARSAAEKALGYHKNHGGS